ncbi:hypothetical protein SUGI_0376820 [Cryptomeria japonica]|nr:hypothetical protein SUGI_0376820 [Cryptomeria japonica]
MVFNHIPKIVEDFRTFAEVCFREFGDRVNAGDSMEEPYIVAHHVSLLDAEAIELYRENFQAKQKGFISLVILAMWYVPLTNSSKDIAAT